MNGQNDEHALGYGRADDRAARVIAYFGPYLFWGAVGVVTTGLLLLG
ncbi:MAG TPA: hypothetical protein VF210_11080 [Pseudomonadales bacterium]